MKEILERLFSRKGNQNVDLKVSKLKKRWARNIDEEGARVGAIQFTYKIRWVCSHMWRTENREKSRLFSSLTLKSFHHRGWKM
jgi:hypothetical protein